MKDHSATQPMTPQQLHDEAHARWLRENTVYVPSMATSISQPEAWDRAANISNNDIRTVVAYLLTWNNILREHIDQLKAQVGKQQMYAVFTDGVQHTKWTSHESATMVFRTLTLLPRPGVKRITLEDNQEHVIDQLTFG